MCGEVKCGAVAHGVAGVRGLVVGRGEREPYHGDDGVQDEGEKHVLVEGDSLAAETPKRWTERETGREFFGSLRQYSVTVIKYHIQFDICGEHY